MASPWRYKVSTSCQVKGKAHGGAGSTLLCDPLLLLATHTYTQATCHLLHSRTRLLLCGAKPPAAMSESQKETFRKYLEQAGAIDVLVKGESMP